MIAKSQINEWKNINYEKDAVFKYLKYLKTTIDALVDMPIGKSLIIDSNNRFDYISPENVSNKTNEINEQSTENQYPNAKAVYEAIKDFDAKFFKKIAFENYRQVDINANTTITLKDTDEIIYLLVSSNATITFDTSQLTFPKDFYTVQFQFRFSNGIKTVSFATNKSNGIYYINAVVPDFSNGLAHWVVARLYKDWDYLLLSDAGCEGR